MDRVAQGRSALQWWQLFARGPVRRRLAACLVLFCLGLAHPPGVHGADVTISWNPASQPDIVGYRVYYGDKSRDYQHSVDVGGQIQCTLQGLDGSKPHYVAVTSYTRDGTESAFSEELPVYTIIVEADPNGRITPGTGMVGPGGSRSFTIAAQPGYRIDSVEVDGSSVGAVGAYTFSKVNECHTIAARFALATYTISSESHGLGTIEPSGVTVVSHGESLTYTIRPDPGQTIRDVVVDDLSLGAISSYTFSNIDRDHTIVAEFRPIDASVHSITARASTGGAVYPSGIISVADGGSVTFSVEPAPGYQLIDVSVDGIWVGPLRSYGFVDVRDNHEIEGLFAKSSWSPMADAGPDQWVQRGADVVLNGRNSIDPDGSALVCQWKQTAGLIAVLSDPNACETVFTVPDQGLASEALLFKLRVTNDAGLTSTDTCIVNVSADRLPPQAEAGKAQLVGEGVFVTLEGDLSFDPDNGISEYRWSVAEGPNFPLLDANTPYTGFPTSTVGENGISVVVELMVTDLDGMKAMDSTIVNISWSNLPPEAVTGTNQTVCAGQIVRLDGFDSSDRDGNALSYRWRQLQGIPVTLSNPVSAEPHFMAPEDVGKETVLIFQLQVTDAGGLIGADKCQIAVQPCDDG